MLQTEKGGDIDLNDGSGDTGAGGDITLLWRAAFIVRAVVFNVLALVLLLWWLLPYIRLMQVQTGSDGAPKSRHGNFNSSTEVGSVWDCFRVLLQMERAGI